MQTTSNTTPSVHVLQATSGRTLAQAANLFLRAPRVGEPWRAGAASPILLALVDRVPAAVAEVRSTPFGKVGLDRIRTAPGADAQSMRQHLTDFLNTPSATGRTTAGRRSSQALAA